LAEDLLERIHDDEQNNERRIRSLDERREIELAEHER